MSSGNGVLTNRNCAPLPCRILREPACFERHTLIVGDGSTPVSDQVNT